MKCEVERLVEDPPEGKTVECAEQHFGGHRRLSRGEAQIGALDRGGESFDAPDVMPEEATGHRIVVAARYSDLQIDARQFGLIGDEPDVGINEVVEGVGAGALRIGVNGSNRVPRHTQDGLLLRGEEVVERAGLDSGAVTDRFERGRLEASLGEQFAGRIENPRLGPYADLISGQTRVSFRPSLPES